VGDALNKLIKLLDQLLPFLESAPTWLRIWVYALIVLNFVTIAGISVAYLISKQARQREATLERFTIDSPAHDELIPLSETNTWTVVGKFPIIPPGQNPQKAVQVDVLQLPGKEKVPQPGSPQITTEGRWFLYSAKFQGAGSYEIVATATLGDRSDSRSVQVRCKDKASAYRESIENDRKQRGAPPIAWPNAEDGSIPQIESRLGALQEQFYQQYFAKHDLPQSLETVNLALNVTEPLLPLFPNDYVLQSFRAYMLKNYALIMRDMGRQRDADRSIEEAAKMFGALYEQSPNDVSVLNGLGDMALWRGDPQTALQYIDKALFLEPGYQEARNDREVALAMIKAQEKSPQH
jgi:tetratricopeptide (TPR) repeat protein